MFYQFIKDVFINLSNKTMAIIYCYIVHEQYSSIRNNNCVRRITNKELSEKLGISESNVRYAKQKLSEMNLLVENSPIPVPRIPSKLVWNEQDNCYQINDLVDCGDGSYRDVWYLSAVDEIIDPFEKGFIKVPQNFLLDKDIDIDTKYWTIFFKLFEPNENWNPTWEGIAKQCCYSSTGIRHAYYKLVEKGFVHNDTTIDISVNYKRIQAKSYSIDFNI